MAKSSRHRGWYNDTVSNDLQALYNGTPRLEIDATGTTFYGNSSISGTWTVAGNMTVSGTSTLGGNTTVNGNTAVTGTLTVSGTSQLTGGVSAGGILNVAGNISGASALGVAGKISYYDQLIHGNASAVGITANTTLTVSESGKVVQVSGDNISLTLPASVLGYRYKIVSVGADSTSEVIIHCNSGDTIVGCGLSTTTSNLTLTNTDATHRAGDYVDILGAGSNAWYIQSLAGTWAT